MIDNPEFRRNLWLELTPHRLVATPVILLLLLTLLVTRGEDTWRGSVATAAAVIFTIFTILWGGRRAYEAIVDEVRERTWDTQRMSALSPWEMTCGKLLGSTLFNWYIGAYCLLALVVSFDDTARLYLHGWSALETGLLLILAALFVHGSGLLSGLTAIKSGSGFKSSRNIPVAFLGVILLLALGRTVLQQAGSTIDWYGISWDGKPFVVASLAAFTAWVCLGAHRVMSDVLAVRSMPWAALAFVIFATAYLCGFIADAAWNYESRFAAIGSLVGGTAVYIEAWKERRDWIAVQRFLRAWREDPPLSALTATPDWLVVALFTLLVSLTTSLLPSNHPYFPGLSRNVLDMLTLSPTVLTLLMFRDIGLLYYFSLGSRPDRATSATLLYLVVLYVVLPSLLNLGGMGFLAFPAVLPVEHGSSWAGVIVAAGHVAVVLALLRRRLQKF